MRTVQDYHVQIRSGGFDARPRWEVCRDRQLGRRVYRVPVGAVDGASVSVTVRGWAGVRKRNTNRGRIMRIVGRIEVRLGMRGFANFEGHSEIRHVLLQA